MTFMTDRTAKQIRFHKNNYSKLSEVPGEFELCPKQLFSNQLGLEKEKIYI